MSWNRKNTDEQIIEAVNKHGSFGAAAKALGVDRRRLTRRFKSIASYQDRMAADANRDDVDPGVVEAATETGLSLDSARHGWRRVQREDGGFDSVFWKQEQESEEITALREAAQAMVDDIQPVVKVKAPPPKNADLLNLFVLTDLHIGMLAWAEETDEDWDSEIAEKILVSWFAEAIRRAPDADQAVLGQIGDFLHYDSLDAVTPQNRNLLDSDTRYAKMVRLSIRVIRQVIDMLRENYRDVHIIWCEGNHDLQGSIWMREMLAALYSAEPRVTVDCSPKPFHCFEHGDVSLFFHHGHQVRMPELDRVMAAEFRETFGRTRHSYAHMGHLHHKAVKESSLMIIEQHRTLASRDAHSARHGYGSGREAQCITYHRTSGEVGRVIISPEMLE